MNPIRRFERDDLLDDVRFWALLYEHWVKPRVGDNFDDGEQYFFSVRESAVNAFFQKLEGNRTQRDHYPEYSVLIPLRKGWRIGVVLRMYPESFEMQYVVAPPSSDERIVVGVASGNSRLPAFRWEELLMVSDAVKPSKLAVKAKAKLLLFPSVFIVSSDLDIAEVGKVLENAWAKSGLAIKKAEELVRRPVEDFVGLRRLYPKMKETRWLKDRPHGWINDSPYSLRNPNVNGSERVIPAIRELFSTLASGA